jgi:serine/threonine-protein kinase
VSKRSLQSPASTVAPIAPGELLNSWKEIASYLNRDIRTLQRWERSKDLPIHRLPGGDKPAVYALKSELDAWLRSRALHTLDEEVRLPAVAREAPSVAVLPFANLSGDRENEYFSDGLADEILTALTRVPGLRVIARTSSFAFRGKDQDVREIGASLDVGALLEGSVRKSGGRIRVAAQLVSTSDGCHLWSERYDRQLTDVFAIQDQVSAAIVEAMRPRLVGAPPPLRRHTGNLQAYNLYLKAQYASNRGTEEALAESRRCFEEAIALDPDYALAYLGLAEQCWDSAYLGLLAPLEAARVSMPLVLRALELDDTLATAHAMLGMFRGAFEYDWAAAEREFHRALELAPASPSVHSRYAWFFLEPAGRLDEALAELQWVLETDPLSAVAHAALAQMLMFRREFPQAERQFRQAIELDPAFWMAHWMLSVVHVFMGMTDQAIAECERAQELFGRSFLVSGALGAMYGVMGRTSDARRLLDGMMQTARETYVSPLGIAWVYFGLGDVDAAFEWLNRGIDEREPQMLHLPAKPIYDPLRADPRFSSLLQRMNLPVP